MWFADNNIVQKDTPQISHSELTNLEAIGQGAFGAVYQAKHALFGRVVYKELDDR